MLAYYKRESRRFRANKWLSMMLRELNMKSFELDDFRPVTSQYTLIMDLIEFDLINEIEALPGRKLTEKPLASPHAGGSAMPSSNQADSGANPSADGSGAGKRKRDADDEPPQTAKDNTKKSRLTPQVKSPPPPSTEQRASGTALKPASETSQKLGNLLQPST
jgi:hypothetical protein